MKPWRKFVIILAVLEVFYLVAANSILSMKKPMEWINTNPRDFTLEYNGASSIIPGVVHLKDVAFRLEDSNVIVYAKIRSVSLSISLFELLFKNVKLTRVAIDEVETFRLKRKVLKGKFLPEIPEPPKLLVKSEPNLALALPIPFNSRDWAVYIQGVHIRTIPEIWIDDYIFRGKSSAGGGFYILPGKEAEVYASEFDLDEGQLFSKDAPIIKGGPLTITTRIRRFQKVEASGWNVFHFIEASSKGKSHVHRWEFLNDYLQGLHWIHLGVGEGDAEWDATLNDGDWKSGSFADFSSDTFRANFWKQDFSGKGKFSWKQDGSDGRVKLQLDSYNIRTASHNTLANGQDLSFVLDFKNANLLKHTTDVSAEIQMPETSVPDFKVLNEFIPESAQMKFTAGSGRLGGVFASHVGAGMSDHGKIRLLTDKLRFKFDDYEVEGAISVAINIHEGNFEKGVFDLSGSELELSGFDRVVNPAPKAWKGQIEILDAKLDYAEPRSLSGKFRLLGTDARPILSLLTHRGSVPQILQTLTSLSDLSASSDFKIQPKEVAFWNSIVTASNVNLVGWYKKMKDNKEGRLLIRLGPLAAGLEIHGDKSSVRLENAAKWFYEYPTPKF